MTAVVALAEILVLIGAAISVLACLSALWLRGVFVRLHYLAPVTSVGGPLIGIGLAIDNGWGLTTGIILVTVAVLAVSGPVVEVATARLMAQREGIVAPESPQ